jgi:rhodanese-related sulfurtransferase
MDQLLEFIQNHVALSAIFVALVFALIITEINRLTRGWKDVSPSQLVMLINRQDAFVVDVSGVADYNKAHISGARNMPSTTFDPAAKELAARKEKPIALYCRSGVNSALVSAKLVKAGFKQVHNLAGGIAAWQAADLPVTRGKN